MSAGPIFTESFPGSAGVMEIQLPEDPGKERSCFGWFGDRVKFTNRSLNT